MIDISIEELVKLKEQGMTDSNIAEYLAKQGKKISAGGVHKRLTAYYHSIGKPKPRGKSITDEELEKMKEQRKSDREIAEYFTKQGRKICLCSVNKRLSKHYKSKNKIKPRARRDNIIKKEITNEEIIELSKQGKTSREIANYFTELGKDISHTAIARRLKRIAVLQTEQDTEEEKKEVSNQENSFRDRIKVTITPTVSEKTKENVRNALKLDKEI